MKDKIQAYFNETGTKPLAVHELEEALEIEEAVEFKELVKALNELEDQGELVRTRKNRFGLPQKMNLIRGKIQMHAKGFAFLIPDDDDLSDIYIHHSDLGSAMNNDTVLVRPELTEKADARPEGKVIRILKRAVTDIVGTFEDNKSFGFVIADDKRIRTE